MPCDYKKNYPKDWKTLIRPAILERDNHKCKFCGVANYSVGYRSKYGFHPTCGNYHHDKAGRGELSYKEAIELANHCNEICPDEKLIVIVLTIMHLDHDTNNNNYDNLAAGCQQCHLRYDIEHHKRNAKETNRKKKGLQDMFK